MRQQQRGTERRCRDVGVEHQCVLTGGAQHHHHQSQQQPDGEGAETDRGERSGGPLAPEPTWNERQRQAEAEQRVKADVQVVGERRARRRDQVGRVQEERDGACKDDTRHFDTHRIAEQPPGDTVRV